MSVRPRTLSRILREEGGQAFIMMILAMSLVFIIGVIVVDFGMWFSGRASVVNATDQASMSASLKLPQDGAGAEADAIAYLQENDPDVDLADINVTFRCIVGDRNGNNLPDVGDIPAICPQLTASDFQCLNGICYADCEFNTPNAKCNTILVTGTDDIPFGFADAAGITSGEVAGFTSAACKGSCGNSPTLPLDVVMVIDRSGSMSSCTSGGNNRCYPPEPGTDLYNAEAAALAVLQLFDPQQQHVALAVLGPSRTDATCGGANSPGNGLIADSGGGSWIASGFSSDYNDGDGNLNNNSHLVKTIKCLSQCSSGNGDDNCYTNLGDPMTAAKSLLDSGGRPGVKKGIIFMTDGEANRPSNPGVTDSTFPFLPCTAQAAVTSNAGDNNGYQNNPNGLCANGGTAGQDPNSGSGTNSSCSSTQKDKHRFRDFGVVESGRIPTTATSIQGIQIYADAWAGSTAGSPTLCARLSWNGGTSWTSYQTLQNAGGGTTLTISEQAYFGGDTDNDWGRTWSRSEFTNANFQVEITNVAGNTSTTFNLDTVQVLVAYFIPDPNFDGPCAYAAEQSDQARALEIDIYTIGYGVGSSFCNTSLEGSGSPFGTGSNRATHLLAHMAHGDIQFDDGGDGFGGLPDGCDSQLAINSENADGDHFLCEARGNDLTPVFKAAAEALAGGSRLIRIPPGY